MKPAHFIILLFVVAVAVFLLYSEDGKQSPEEYRTELETARKEKDLFMKDGRESPFRGSSEVFRGLKYFPADLKYRVTADLVAIPDKKMINLPASDGNQKKYLENSFAEFELDGQSHRLLILEMTENGPYRGTLFLAFADKTSAHETYGAGRYLEIKKIPGANSIVLDFNRAYNPDCAYADNYSCPFPPHENILPIAIYAGEKSYH